MDIETDILLSFKKYINQKSIFRDILKVFPSSPQSFSSFPTIVVREVNNFDYEGAKTLNKMEYMDYLTYQVDIYTQDVVVNGMEYPARLVISELKKLVNDFFSNLNFTRTSSTKGDYIDITVSRHIMLFSAKLNSWNMNLM